MWMLHVLLVGRNGQGAHAWGSKLLYEVILATTELARSLDRGEEGGAVGLEEEGYQ